jgi:hypothetical protein
MNKEIKFRGISKEEKTRGQWVYGYFGIEPNEAGAVILVPTDHVYDCLSALWEHEVIPESVGEYINLKLNGKELYQDDLIGIYEISTDSDGEEIKILKAIIRVKWDDEIAMYMADYIKGNTEMINEICDAGFEYDAEYPISYWLQYMENSYSSFWDWDIIGNATDNPELLKEVYDK